MSDDDLLNGKELVLKTPGGWLSTIQFPRAIIAEGRLRLGGGNSAQQYKLLSLDTESDQEEAIGEIDPDPLTGTAPLPGEPLRQYRFPTIGEEVGRLRSRWRKTRRGIAEFDALLANHDLGEPLLRRLRGAIRELEGRYLP
jgi:hypothetical protein